MSAFLLLTPEQSQQLFQEIIANQRCQRFMCIGTTLCLTTLTVTIIAKSLMGASSKAIEYAKAIEPAEEIEPASNSQESGQK